MKSIVKKVALGIFIATGALSSFAQRQNNETADYSRFHLGLGTGMDYGGLGFKVEYLPIKYLGTFAGIGYNLRELGFNAGVQFRPLPDAKVEPFVIAMYGYNAAMNIKGWEEVSKSYYGFTTGVGGELKVGRKKNRLYLGVLLPFRSKEFKDNYDMVKNSPGIKLSNDILPIGISLGFNWSI
jgi:hypothetical protein